MQPQRRPHAEDIADDDTAVGKTWEGLVRPSRRRVEGWLGVWWKRWGILVVLPCVIVSSREDIAGPINTTADPLRSSFSQVWVWVAIPFPVADPYQPDAPWHIPSPFPSRRNGTDVPADSDDLPLDLNFYFYLVVYYGLYLHVALLFVTKIFDLYRLNWWPSRIGGRLSYAFFWCSALVIGWAAHEVDLVERLRRWTGRERSNYDWERKSFWTTLTFCTMGLPCVLHLPARPFPADSSLVGCQRPRLLLGPEARQAPSIPPPPDVNPGATLTFLLPPLVARRLISRLAGDVSRAPALETDPGFLPPLPLVRHRHRHRHVGPRRWAR